MSFSVKRVREYLLENGFVYTFRKYNLDDALGLRKQLGRDWINSGRHTKKIADVIISPVEEIKMIDSIDVNVLNMKFLRYVRHSGFYDHPVNLLHIRYIEMENLALKRWFSTIERVNRNKRIMGWIYKVTIMKGDKN